MATNEIKILSIDELLTPKENQEPTLFGKITSGCTLLLARSALKAPLFPIELAVLFSTGIAPAFIKDPVPVIYLTSMSKRRMEEQARFIDKHMQDKELTDARVRMHGNLFVSQLHDSDETIDKVEKLATRFGKHTVIIIDGHLHTQASAADSQEADLPPRLKVASRLNEIAEEKDVAIAVTDSTLYTIEDQDNFDYLVHLRKPNQDTAMAELSLVNTATNGTLWDQSYHCEKDGRILLNVIEQIGGGGKDSLF